MRMSMLFSPTLKEAPKEAEVPSHRLLIRGGYIRKLAAEFMLFYLWAIRPCVRLKTSCVKRWSEAVLRKS